MGQKVSPHGLRVGVNKDWSSSWIADKKDIAKFLLEDQNIRKHVVKKYNQCGISKVVIERTANRLIVDIFTSRPGVLIGTNLSYFLVKLKESFLRFTVEDLVPEPDGLLSILFIHDLDGESGVDDCPLSNIRLDHGKVCLAYDSAEVDVTNVSVYANNLTGDS